MSPIPHLLRRVPNPHTLLPRPPIIPGPKTRLHSSATHVDTAATKPSAAEEREASTCGFKSGFHQKACPSTTLLLATRAARKASRSQRLSGANIGPCRCSSTSSCERPLAPVPAAGASLFSRFSCVQLEFRPRIEANRVFNAAPESLRR